MSAEVQSQSNQGSDERAGKPHESASGAGKFVLFVLSIFVAAIGLAIARGIGWPWLPTLFVGIVLLFAYPALGAFGVWASESLKNWAFPEKRQRWTQDERFRVAAVWPGVLSFWCVTSVFHKIVDALFPADR